MLLVIKIFLFVLNERYFGVVGSELSLGAEV